MISMLCVAATIASQLNGKIEGATLREARRAFLRNKKKRIALPGKKKKALPESSAKR